MDYFGSVPFEAMLLEACQPYCNYQPTYRCAPTRGEGKTERCTTERAWALMFDCFVRSARLTPVDTQL
jgi:hypothetical protein